MKIQNYLKNFELITGKVQFEDLDKIILTLKNARKNSNLIFTIGNGGSSSNASHFATDLCKTTRKNNMVSYRTICLSDSIPSLTAYANDLSFDRIYSEQIFNIGGKNDILFSYSCSGESLNILNAIKVANSKNMITITLSGKGENSASRISKFNIIVPTENYGQIENFHLLISHFIIDYLSV